MLIKIKAPSDSIEARCFLASDRQAFLDSELKSLQMSLRELEGFLKWLQEAETTVNVLADASQREELSQDSAHLRELKGQLDVSLPCLCCRL
ncbi:utrophin isoform X1 [Tachysurus ichikawai]